MIIGLIGYMGSGKSEAAKTLTFYYDFKRERMAGPLKDMLRAIGLTEAQVDGDEKEMPCALLGGATPRHAMQTLGTEWGRRCLNDDFWINLWSARALAADRVVCDDVRFPNEVATIRALGGQVWRIVRPGRKVSDHVSEHSLDGFVADAEFINDGTVDDLCRKIDRYMGNLLFPGLIAKAA